MASTAQILPSAIATGNKQTMSGRVVGGIVVAFLLLDGIMKLVPLQPVIDSMAQLGWPTDTGLVRGLGFILIGSAVLYAVPRTALLGAILITAYLGGAAASHVRIGSPLFTHVLFGTYVGVLAWLGLWLREPRLRALLPL